MAQDSGSDELHLWLQRRYARVEKMLDADNPMSAQETFDALTTMAQEYLSFAAKLVKLAEIANNAAESMIAGKPTKSRSTGSRKKPSARRRHPTKKS
jgi:hypothetical protein